MEITGMKTKILRLSLAFFSVHLAALLFSIIIRPGSTIYIVTVFPSALFGWFGLPVMHPPQLVLFVPVIHLTVFGWVLSGVIWLGFYWLLALALTLGVRK